MCYLVCLYFVVSVNLCNFAAKNETYYIMTAVALNNLWTYLQGLTLAKSDREWLANKLIKPVNVEKPVTKSPVVAKVRRKSRPLSPEVEMLGKLNLREFTKEELDADPLLAAIVEDRRERKC